jgi:hypothetical protein
MISKITVCPEASTAKWKKMWNCRKNMEVPNLLQHMMNTEVLEFGKLSFQHHTTVKALQSCFHVKSSQRLRQNLEDKHSVKIIKI